MIGKAMTGINLMGKIGKSVGYMVWAISGVMTITNKLLRRSYDYVANNNRYHVIVMLEGVVMKEDASMPASDILVLLEGMNKLGSYELIIKCK
jgi:hypothetical protein